MAKKPLPCPTVLRQLLRYDPETGKLFWKERAPFWFSGPDVFSAEHRCKTWNARYADKEAMTAYAFGYKSGFVLGLGLRAHRVAWAVHHGAWPKDTIDHIDGVKDNNRIANLRDVPLSVNALNRPSRKGASSKYLGVDLHRQSGRWRVQIKPRNGNAIYLGLFDNEIAAARAYNQAAKEVHGEFARLNEI